MSYSSTEVARLVAFHSKLLHIFDLGNKLHVSLLRASVEGRSAVIANILIQMGFSLEELPDAIDIPLSITRVAMQNLLEICDV